MVRLKVKEVARAKGVTMAKLSRLADLSPKTVQALWHDPFRDVSVSTLDKIAMALHVDVSELLESVVEAKGEA